VPLWRPLRRGLRALLHPDAADHDVDEEARHYIEEAEAALTRDGLSPDGARRAARLEVGHAGGVREQVRSSGWEHIASAFAGDIRYAARRLRRAPGSTIVAVITLAVGIGATTAIFSAVDAILLEPLPYPQPDRIVMIADASAEGLPRDVTFGTYREIAQRSRVFTAMAPFKAWQPTIVGDGEPDRLSGQRVGAGFFRALGVAPVLGRDFQTDDDRPSGPNVAILSDPLWRRQFSADPGIVGRQITLDDTAYLVVGVMPRAFENVLSPQTDVWAPLQYQTVYGPQDREWGHHLRLVARLQPRVELDRARQELNQIARAPISEFARVPWADLQNGFLVTSLQADATRGIRPALLAVMGAVMLLLASACVNVTNLLLARGAQRRGEIAMRAALGAGRSRIVRQLLTESVLLSLLGGALGIFVAEVGIRTLVALSPPGLPRVGAIRIDAAAFAFAAIITMLAGVIVGAIPAVHVSRPDLQAAIQEGSRRTAGGHQRTRGGLVVAEVALALVLLVSAGLLLRSIERVFAAPVGFDASHLLTMEVQETGQRFRDDRVSYRFYTDALDAVRAVPGVSAAGFTALLPLSSDTGTFGVHFELDRGTKEDGAALRYAVTPGYFDAMRIPLRRGRLLDAHDGADAPRAALLNESFAKRRFASGDALGQRFRFGPEEGDWYTVVGIVGDVKQSALDLDQPDAIYVPAAQWHWVDHVMSLVVRARGDAAALTPAIRRAIWSVDKDQPIVRIATMDALVERSVSDRRFALVLFEAFGVAALILAATGIYGVLSGGVTERMREIGVRSALGASPGDIVGLVVRQGMTLAGLGVLIGLCGAFVASRAIAALLFGVSRLDPATYAAVVAMLLTVSAIACWAPAWRAVRVDPSIALRQS
jgi:putative ABC transport system permease protein